MIFTKQPFSGQEIIGHVMYGYFDMRPGWELDLETLLMEEKKWRYKDKSDEKRKGEVSNWKKGSIAKIITDTKESQVKRIRMAGKKKEVKVYKKRKEGDENTKQRRKKGEFRVLQVCTEKQNETSVLDSKNDGRKDASIEDALKQAAIKEGLTFEQYNSLYCRMLEIMNRGEQALVEDLGPNDTIDEESLTNEEYNEV